MINVTKWSRWASIQTLGLIAAIAVLGIGAPALAQTADTSPPSVPASVSVAFNPPSQVTISWGASTDNVGVSGYYIYRNGVQITATGDTSYVDGNLLPGSYTYTVAAYDAAGNVSQQSATQWISITLDTTAPTAPTGLTISATTSTATQSTEVALSWNAATDNVGVAGYNVYRNGQLLSTSTRVSATSYTDYVPAGAYTYAVTAYDAAQNVSSTSSRNYHHQSRQYPPVFTNKPRRQRDFVLGNPSRVGGVNRQHRR